MLPLRSYSFCRSDVIRYPEITKKTCTPKTASALPRAPHRWPRITIRIDTARSPSKEGMRCGETDGVISTDVRWANWRESSQSQRSAVRPCRQANVEDWLFSRRADHTNIAERLTRWW